MQTETIAGIELQFDDEGFLIDPMKWTDDVGAELAKQIDISLTDDHWRVIKFARADFEESGESPTVRRVSTMADVSTKDLYQLFPKKPAKKLAFIAGIPKPKGCV